MNTQDYLKQAADSLRQAVAATKADIDEIRRAIAARDQETRAHVNELKQRESARLTEAGVTDSDQWKAQRLRDAVQLRNEESQVEQDYKRQKQKLDEWLARKQQSIDQLNQMVRALDGQASQAAPPSELI